MGSLKSIQTIFTILAFLLFTSCTSLPSVKKKEYVKTFKDSDFLITWEYDFSKEDNIIVKGMVKKYNGYGDFESMSLTVTGLDSEGNRLNAGFSYLVSLEMFESDRFEIRIPKDGREKSFLFTYDYDFLLDHSPGPVPMTIWFKDFPDPASIPKMIFPPPGYKSR